jgi:hypothetical protein
MKYFSFHVLIITNMTKMRNFWVTSGNFRVVGNNQLKLLTSLFIFYGLLNDAVSSLDYTASNGKIIGE